MMNGMWGGGVALPSDKDRSRRHCEVWVGYLCVVEGEKRSWTLGVVLRASARWQRYKSYDVH